MFLKMQIKGQNPFLKKNAKTDNKINIKSEVRFLIKKLKLYYNVNLMKIISRLRENQSQKMVRTDFVQELL